MERVKKRVTTVPKPSALPLARHDVTK
jgi:hypothetical protein